MKYRLRIAAVLLIACMALTLSGCRLAREDTAGESSETPDKMIGVLVTTKDLDLFDMEGYFKNNVDQLLAGGMIEEGDPDARQYQGRLYAMLKHKTMKNDQTGETAEHAEYVFEGVDGIFYFAADGHNGSEHCVISGSDPAISDGHIAYGITDAGSEKTLEATIYLAPEAFGSPRFFNPVYQSEDGKVYAVSGQGISSEGVNEEGSAFSQTLEESHSTTVDGKTVTDSIRIKISLSVLIPPTKIIILQMDEKSAILSRIEYAPGQLPTAIAPRADAEYIILETYKTGSEGKERIARALYGKDADSLEAFFCRADGICQKQPVQISWLKG